MGFKDLQEFMRFLDKKGELKTINTEVDSDLEITEIADRVSKQYGPALLFKNVRDSEFPVLINAMGTYERMSAGIGCNELDELGDLIGEFIDMSNYMGVSNIIKSVPRLTRLPSVLTIKVPGKGACQEVVNMNPDLNKLPILKCWPQDGGKFITLPLVFTKDPETNIQNTGMYRLQVFDSKTTGMHWHLHKDGREIYDQYKKIGGKMPVSVALGCDPAITYAATAPLPKMIDEMMFAGFLRKRPVKMVKSITNDIYVPASAEFIIEGYVDVNEELRLEGPFGDHTGYYSLADYYPQFHVTCITHKKNAVYPTTIVGKPPMEDCYMGKATERLFLPLLKMQYPEIVDYNFPLEGVFHNCVIISIDKRFPGHGKKVMNSLWGIGQMMYTKMIIVVDKDVKPQDIKTVVKKVLNNVDVRKDLVISEGPLDALDHASNLPHYGYRLGIDATTKLKEEGLDRICIDGMEEIKGFDNSNKKITLDLLKSTCPEIVGVDCSLEGALHNALIVSIDKKQGKQAKKVMDALWELEETKYTKYIIIVDKVVNPSDMSTVSWKVFNNIDANRDLYINENNNLLSEEIPYFKLRAGIDATKKWKEDGHDREWPDDIEMSDEVKALVDRRWSEYGI